MGVMLVTAPTLDPVTIAEARAHCRADSAEEEGLIAGYILAARQHVETHLRRALLTQTWDLTIDEAWPLHHVAGRTRHRIVLPLPPLQSVVSITYVDTTGATQTLAADQYHVAKIDSGEWVIEPAYGVTWPTVRSQLAAITVRFIAGYGSNPGDIPEPIRQAMLLLIGSWFENREQVITGTIVAELPMGVEALLFPHRVFY